MRGVLAFSSPSLYLLSFEFPTRSKSFWNLCSKLGAVLFLQFWVHSNILFIDWLMDWYDEICWCCQSHSSWVASSSDKYTLCFFLGPFFKCEQSNHVNIFTRCMLFIFKGNTGYKVIIQLECEHAYRWGRNLQSGTGSMQWICSVKFSGDNADIGLIFK